VYELGLLELVPGRETEGSLLSSGTFFGPFVKGLGSAVRDRPFTGSMLYALLDGGIAHATENFFVCVAKPRL
jgi:hypothetical protein